MSTRSCIASFDPETGTARSIYCHFDGYPDGVGAMLVNHYATPELVDALMDLGDISGLNERLAPAPGEKHSFDNRAPGVTVAYGRDRGETGTEAREWKQLFSIGDLAKKLIEYYDDSEFVYIHDGSTWYVIPIWGDKRLHKVTEILKGE